MVKFRSELLYAIRLAQKEANKTGKTHIIQCEGDCSLQVYAKKNRYIGGRPVAELSPERKK